MKKYFLIAVVGLLLLTGCGKKQVVCTGTTEENGMKLTESVIAELDSSDKVTKVSMEAELPDADTAKQYCQLYQTVFGEDAVKCNGKKFTIEDATKLMGEEDNVIGMSKDDFVKMLTDESAESGTEITCK